jgi:hypothetical protein
MKNGKVRKGYREVACKNGSVKYMRDNATAKPATKAKPAAKVKPETKAKPKAKPVKSPAKAKRTKKAVEPEPEPEKVPDLPNLERKDPLTDYSYPKGESHLAIL